MKKVILGPLFFCSVFFVMNAQNVHRSLTTPASLNTSDIHLCSDGGALISMQAPSGGAFSDNYLLKTDASGNAIWFTKIMADSELIISNFKLVQSGETPDGKYYALAQVTRAGSLAIQLTKMQTNGTVIWNTLIPVQGTMNYYIDSKLNMNAAGDFIINPSAMDLGGSIKVLANGSVAHNKSLTDDDSTSKNPSFEDIFTDDDGNGGCGKDNNSLFMYKAAPGGAITWSTRLNNSVYNRPYSMIQMTDHGFLLSGLQADLSYANWQGFMMRTNSSGTVLWHKLYTAAGTPCYFTNVFPQEDGSYYIAGQGQSASDVSLANPYWFHIASDGSVISAKRITMPSAGFYSIFQDHPFAFDLKAGKLAITGTNEYIFTDVNLSGVCEVTDVSVVVTDQPAVSPATANSVHNWDCPLAPLTGNPVLTVSSATQVDACTRSLGINEINKVNDLIVFPTLTSPKAILTVKGDYHSASSLAISVLDMQGKIAGVYSANASALMNGVGISAPINSGIYFVRVTESSGNLIGSGKIVVQ